MLKGYERDYFWVIFVERKAAACVVIIPILAELRALLAKNSLEPLQKDWKSVIIYLERISKDKNYV